MDIQIGLPCTDPQLCNIFGWGLALFVILVVVGFAHAFWQP